jgi:hypothetical protein
LWSLHNSKEPVLEKVLPSARENKVTPAVQQGFSYIHPLLSRWISKVRRRCILGLMYSAYSRLESYESVMKSFPLKPWGSGPLWHGRFWGSGLEYVEHIEPKIQGRHGFGDLMIFRHRCLLMKTTCCLSSQLLVPWP